MCADATARQRLPQISSDAAVSSSGTPRKGLEDYRARTPPGILFAIALFALATHFLYFNHFRNYYAPDSASYITPAFNLIHGDGFMGSDGRPETFRTPGYPLLIAPFLRARLDLRYLVMLQHLMQVLLTVAVAAASFHLFRSVLQALTAGFLLSIDLPTLEASNAILTETLFTVTLAAVLWLLWTGSRQSKLGSVTGLVCAGLVAGGAALIRPIGLYFFLPITAYLVLTQKQRRLQAALGFLVAFACLPLIWAVRNYKETGYFTVSSASGLELLCCRAAGVLALDDPGEFNANVTKRRAQLETTVCNDLKTRYGKDCSQLSFAQRSEYAWRAGGTILRQHPLGSLRLALRGAVVLLLDGGPSSLEGITGANPHLGIRLLLIYTVPALCLAVVGLYNMWKKNRPLFYLFFVTIAYFVVLSAGGDSYSRHRAPIVPLYVMLTAAGVETLLRTRPVAEPVTPL